MEKNKRRVLYDNINKKLVAGIVIVSVLLIFCVAIDYADETITNVNNHTVQKMPKNVTVVNSSYTLSKNTGMAVSDGKVYTDKNVKTKHAKKKTPTITMWAKPSVRCGYSYTWHKKTFVNYCPNCKHYNTLLKNPKGVPEQEYTCARCDSDFCGVTGKEKYSWSRVYLIPA